MPTLGAINLEAADPAKLAAFWSAVTSATPAPGGDSIYLPAAGPDGFAMFFRPQSAPRPDHQTTHLDLTVPWGSRQAEVDRLIGLGATFRWHVLDEVPHVRWTTLADPRATSSASPNTHPPRTRDPRPPTGSSSPPTGRRGAREAQPSTVAVCGRSRQQWWTAEPPGARPACG